MWAQNPFCFFDQKFLHRKLPFQCKGPDSEIFQIKENKRKKKHIVVKNGVSGDMLQENVANTTQHVTAPCISSFFRYIHFIILPLNCNK